MSIQSIQARAEKATEWPFTLEDFSDWCAHARQDIPALLNVAKAAAELRRREWAAEFAGSAEADLDEFLDELEAMG